MKFSHLSAFAILLLASQAQAAVRPVELGQSQTIHRGDVAVIEFHGRTTAISCAGATEEPTDKWCQGVSEKFVGDNGNYCSPTYINFPNDRSSAVGQATDAAISNARAKCETNGFYMSDQPTPDIQYVAARKACRVVVNVRFTRDRR